MKYKAELQMESVPFEEIKAQRVDRKKFEQELRHMNTFSMKSAISYLRECYTQLEFFSLPAKEKFRHVGSATAVEDVYKYLDDLKNMYLSKEVIESMSQHLNKFLETYQQYENVINKIVKESYRIEYIADLNKLSKKTDKEHYILQKEVVKKAETTIIYYANHIEDYNNYYGACKRLGELKRPKIKNCFEDCQKCIPASKIEKGKWQKITLDENHNYFTLANSYLKECTKQFTESK